jgi:hypothetical protein
MNDPFEGLSVHPATCVWRLAAPPAGLPEETAGRLGGLLERLERGAPIAPSALPFELGRVVRPPGHRRCFYVRLGDEPLGSHLAIKGTEPLLLEQLQAMLRTGLPRARMGAHALTALDYFPIHEHKAPMLLLAREALDEAEIGDALCAAYVARYREVPPLPLPLFAFQWPQAVVDAYWKLLEPELSPWAREITARLIAGGAGCYVYHYPTAPFPRVRHVAASLRARGVRADRVAVLAEQHAPADVIERWVRLFVRLLALGYLPSTESQIRSGQAVQAQNAVVGSGFVDLDSVRPLAQVTDEADLLGSYMLGVRVLAATVSVYLFGEQAEVEGSSGPYASCLAYVYDAVARLAAEDARDHGDSFDPRLRALPPFRADAAGLVELARAFQRQPLQEDMERALDRR